MAVAIVSGLEKHVAGVPLLQGVSFKLERRDRLALSGRNGSGKTTLLRILAGEMPLDGGELSIEKGATLALHDQRPPRDRGLSLREYVLSGCAGLVAVEHELARLEQAMAQGTSDQATLAAYAAAQERLEHAGGYDWRRRAMSVVRGLGFADADLERPLRTFSGGELTRASLARTLAGDPDLLLLDEPTNHLDVASLEWLEQQLTTMDAAIILVAHDRWFLEAVGTAVLELEDGRSRFFAGPWHAWRKERAARELALGRAVDRQQAEIERLERFVTRFRAGTRSRQAQSRVKKLEKMDTLERDPRARHGPAIAFEGATRTGRVVLELEDGLIAAGDRTLIEKAELWLERGEHVTLVGPNGSGKTTLIETLAGRRPLPSGKLRRGHNVELAFLSQHAEEIDRSGTAVEAVQQAATGLTPGKARALLGRFLFSGADAAKEVAVLSGGELRRLSLAILVASGANTLIVDEPTNHLDLESREALEDALQAYEGTVLLVSHDRALLDAVGTRTIALEDGALRSYEGGWADYMRVREERRTAEAQDPAAGAKRNGRRREGQAAKPVVSKNAKRRIATLEREIEQAEAALGVVEDELADSAAWATPDRSARATERHRAAKRAVEELYEELSALDGG